MKINKDMVFAKQFYNQNAYQKNMTINYKEDGMMKSHGVAKRNNPQKIHSPFPYNIGHKFNNSNFIHVLIEIVFSRP